MIVNQPAPELQVSAWLNTAQPLSLAALRGKVVALYAFQMLCPGCVSHGIPQAKLICDTFDTEARQLGALIGQLLAEPMAEPAVDCSDEGCAIRR